MYVHRIRVDHKITKQKNVPPKDRLLLSDIKSIRLEKSSELAKMKI